MEPRPSRPSRAPSGSSGSSASSRAPWTGPPSPPPSQAPPTQASGLYGGAQSNPNPQGNAWYGPQGGPGSTDGQDDYRTSSPSMPILPRHERGNRILRYLVAVVLLIAIVGGSAFAVTRYLDRDDGAGQTETAQTIPSTDPADAEGEGGGAGLATPEADDEGSAADEAAEPASTPTDAVEETTEETVVDETDEVTPTPEGAVLAQQTGDDESAQQGDQATEGETDAASNDGPVGAAGYLPEATDLGEGWTIQDEGERTREEVAVQLGDDGDALLTSWRWRENPYRNFIRGNAANFPSEATFVSVSAHRFASPEGAAEALQYLADIVVTGQGLQDVEMEPIGDESRGLFGPSEGANLYVLYVRDGNYVIRLGGSSATGDPSPQVDAVAQQLVAAN